LEVDGRLYLNLAFDLKPRGSDIRDKVIKDYWPTLKKHDLLILRVLSPSEEKMLRNRIDDAEIEVWASIVVK
jgi:hypothetical protein